jgi:phage gp46-like protein
MDYQVQYSIAYPQGYMTWNKNTDLTTDIGTSLNIRQGTFFQNLDFGSQLFKVKTVTKANLLLLQQYAVDCLQWIIQAGMATAITAQASVDPYSSYRYDLTISVTQANGVTLQYQFAQSVASGTSTWIYVGP